MALSTQKVSPFITEFQNFEFHCLAGNYTDFQIDGNSLSPHDLQSLQLCFNLQNINDLLRKFVEQDFKSILYMKISEIFKCKSKQTPLHSIYEKLLEELLIFAQSNDSSICTYVAEFVVLLFGVASLSEFVRYNWLGPTDNGLQCADLVSDIFTDKDDLSTQSSLFFRDEDISPNVRELNLLFISHFFLSAISNSLCVSQKWWMFRCLMVHQKIASDKKLSLYSEMKLLMNDVLEIDFINKESNISLKLQILVESAFMHLYYGEVALAKKHVVNAQELTGLDIEFSGAFGKRTQYQVKPVAQLYIELKRNKSFISFFNLKVDDDNLPCDIILQDDTLLNKVSFIDDSTNFIEDLLVEEQVVLLGSCYLMRKSNAFDELLKEQMMAFINCLLSQPKLWCIYVSSLIMRCRSEKESSRKVERAMMQMQALVDAVKKSAVPFSLRHCMFYCCPIPTHWLLEKELADILLSLGATKSALEIYERLQLWEDIVICYQKLGRNNKAEEVVRKQLENVETPNLYCLLGDVTCDPNYYLKAWDLSNKKSSRAQKSLGYYYYKRKEYETCIPFFVCSLEINHLQQNVWFSVGHAANQVKNYELSARAYRQVVTLDQDNFEAWNNLSNAYIQSGNKFRAWKSLQEALKCNYEHWKVWENFLLVSIDIGAFDDAINAWHRLLDIKQKHDDPEILNILVKAIVNNLTDSNGRPSNLLQKKASKLLGRITSITTNDSVSWELYSLLLSSDDTITGNKESMERIVLYQQKSVRCFMQKQSWYKEYLSCKQVLKSSIRLGEVTRDYVKLLEGTQKVHQQNSLKLMLQGVINLSEKSLENFAEVESEELNLDIKCVKEDLIEVLAL